MVCHLTSCDSSLYMFLLFVVCHGWLTEIVRTAKANSRMPNGKLGS